MQRTALDDDRRDDTAPLIDPRFENLSFGAAVVIGFQFEHFRLQQNRIEKIVYAFAFKRADIDILRIAAPIFRRESALGKLRAHAVGIRFRLIDFIDRNDDRNFRIFRVVDRFERLRHNAVVRCDHEDRNVRRLPELRAHASS